MNRFGPGQMLAWRRVLAANDNGLLLCTKSCYMYIYDHTLYKWCTHISL